MIVAASLWISLLEYDSKSSISSFVIMSDIHEKLFNTTLILEYKYWPKYLVHVSIYVSIEIFRGFLGIQLKMLLFQSGVLCMFIRFVYSSPNRWFTFFGISMKSMNWYNDCFPEEVLYKLVYPYITQECSFLRSN